MIDKDTLRTARRTVERNGYTVLPPRDRDEKDLNRFRTRREVEREGNEDYRPTRTVPRFRDAVEEDEQPRRFKPLRQREYDDEDDFEPRRQARPTRQTRQVEDDYDDEPQRPTRQVRTSRPVEDDYDDEPRRPARPAPRREMNDDEKLGAAIRTAEENGFTIRKMSKLDQAKQIARDNGYDIRRMDDDDDDETPRRPTRRVPTQEEDGGNDRPARTVPARAQRPLIRPKANTNVNDGIRTRTAPDTEIKGNVDNTTTQTQEPAPAAAPTETPAEPPKKPTYADDFMDRAARFFGEDE